MEDHSQAVSFANSYFSLVDGLAPGLEHHLAENVVLDWFGRTIRGRKNVTEFMKLHKVHSRHVFNDIKSVNDINYKKSQTKRKSMEGSKTDNWESSLLMKKGLNFEKLSINELPTIDPENNNNVLKNYNDEVESSNVIYELDENDLTNLFALKEITLSRDEEIEETIKRIKNEEEKLITGNKSIANELMEEEDGENDRESNCKIIKYVEANGEIEFSKKTNKRGTDLHIWKRHSQLQIAYSFTTSEISEFYDNQEMEIEGDALTSGFDKIPTESKIIRDEKLAPSFLPSLVEITEISNKLVPNTNNFGGYFTTVDFITERDNFLKNLNAELTLKNATAEQLRTPRYVDNRLVFNDRIINKSDYRSNDLNKYYKGNGRGFVFNYLIDIIIYQGNSKCRRSLTKDFGVSNNKINKKFLSSDYN